MNTVFLVIFVVLQGLDIWTTDKALKMGKREANPFLAYLFTVSYTHLTLPTKA